MPLVSEKGGGGVSQAIQQLGWAGIIILFASPYPSDPGKKPTQKNYFNYQSRIFFKISLQIRELSNVNSVI